MSVEYVVILVHGTWARRASWTGESSSFCRGLRELLPSPVVFERFEWSGRNTASARRKATDDLVAYLRQLLQRRPNAHHYVVAHSHGGNIALYALRDSELNRGIAGIACLATPFLNVKPRYLGPFGPKYLSILISAIIFLTVPIGVTWAVALASSLLSGFPDWLFIIGFALTLPVLFHLFFFMVGRWLELGRGLEQGLAFPEIESSRLLIIRTIGDEAQAALAGTQLVGWLFLRFWLPIGRLAGRIASLRGLRWTIGVVFLALAAALLAPFLAIISILLLPVAPELALFPHVNIAVEATPEGSWVVHQLPSLDDPQLSHSQSHADPRTVALIATWMKSARNAV